MKVQYGVNTMWWIKGKQLGKNQRKCGDHWEATKMNLDDKSVAQTSSNHVNCIHFDKPDNPPFLDMIFCTLKLYTRPDRVIPSGIEIAKFARLRIWRTAADRFAQTETKIPSGQIVVCRKPWNNKCVQILGINEPLIHQTRSEMDNSLK